MIQQSHLNKARTDKFTLVINIPDALKNINSKYTRNNKTIQLDSLQFSIFGTIVPDVQVPAIETKWAGSNIYISSHARPPYPPSTVNFTIDNQFNNYWIMYQWLNLMRDDKEGAFGGITDARDLISQKDIISVSKYSTTFNVFGKDEFNNDVIKFEYFNAFPTQLGGINYSYQGSDLINSSFQFVYSNINVTLL